MTKKEKVDELIIANEEKEKRADELIIANKEKQKRADELIIANKELVYQNEEKEKRATELILANEAILQSEENIEIINAGSAEHKEVQLKNLKILIVEDNEISYSLLTRMLQNISKEVLHAITGVQAVEACRNNPDLDLVLMDIRMPVMDGNEATRQIRQFNKDVIIIAQTASGFSDDREKTIEAGCNDYISKPINKTLLFELIKKHFIK
jgi:CheY-like chemotaxis protein